MSDEFYYRTRSTRRNIAVYGRGPSYLAEEKITAYFAVELRNGTAVCVCANAESEEILARYRERLVSEHGGDCSPICQVTEENRQFARWQLTHWTNVKDGEGHALLEGAIFNGEWRKPQDICPDPADINKLLYKTPPYPHRLPEASEPKAA